MTKPNNHWYLYFGNLQMKLLRDSFQLLERSLQESSEKFNDELEARAKDIADDDFDVLSELYDQHIDDIALYGLETPRLLTNAFFLTYYTHFEHSLDRLCAFQFLQRNLPVEASDLNGSGVVRSVKYLVRIGTLSIKTDDDIYGRIIKYNKLRNAIVHTGGQTLKPDGKRIRRKAPVHLVRIYG